MFKTIIWATDGSASADKALPYARSLAEREGGSLVVVHAIERFVGSRAAGLPVHADEDELRAKVERQVAELQSAGVHADLVVETDGPARPAHMVAEVARKVGADLIVAGTRGHTAISGLILGSVTHRLLHVAPCPVLAVPAQHLETDSTAAAAGAVGQTG